MEIYNFVRKYIKYSIKIEMPWIVATVLIICGLVLLTIYLYKKGRVHRKQFFGVIALPTYLFLLFSSTVFCRNVEQGHALNLEPFWTYKAIICEGKLKYLPEVLVNITMFLVIGVLLSQVFKNMSKKKLVGVAIVISLSIEILQFLFMRGLAEFDDVFNNVLGAIIGIEIYEVLSTFHMRKAKE